MGGAVRSKIPHIKYVQELGYHVQRITLVRIDRSLAYGQMGSIGRLPA